MILQSQCCCQFMPCTWSVHSIHLVWLQSNARANATENTGLTIVLYHRWDLEHSKSVASHGLIIATVSSWVHLILSSNSPENWKLCCKTRSLCTWHHHSTSLLEKLHWLPISERIKSLVCVSVLEKVLFLLTSLNCYMSTHCLIHYTLLLTPACWKSNNTNARLMAFAPSLALDPTFGIHSHKTWDTAQPCHLLKPNWKPSFSQRFQYPVSASHVCACFHILYVNCFW